MKVLFAVFTLVTAKQDRTPEIKIVDSGDHTNKVGCLFNLDGNIYDLSPLTVDPAFADKMYQVSFEDKFGTSTIEFNFCEQTARTCPDLKLDYANVINGNNTC